MVVNKQNLNGSNYPLRPTNKETSNNPNVISSSIPANNSSFGSSNNLSANQSLNTSQEKLASFNPRADSNNNLATKRTTPLDVDDEEKTSNNTETLSWRLFCHLKLTFLKLLNFKINKRTKHVYD